ncbi:M56 family metallopeptidase [Nonomuraea sp. NBC_01738]|uniref:M56 family metallopeptidase n=1 Tax=Nonomuraea sp. NBC_01738 TaxID=2976003 RepID=UPI002E0E9589|nr:M56 family metallopeptidase [Nonomuraea sp. NBC_01738]
MSAVLALYAVVAATLLPRLLGRASWRSWAERAPRLAIVTWQAAGFSVVAAALLAAISLALPADAIGHGLARFFAACVDGPDLSLGSVRAGLAGAALLGGRLAYSAARVLLGARRERRRHLAMLSLLGTRDPALGAVVIEYGERVAYCLPGRRAQTVITTAALESLSPEQVAAVLAHEHAHLRGRHHLVLAAAESLARAFPRVPLFERSREEIARLVELLADDLAARRHDRVHIAAALVGLATGRVPGFALGAGGETALTRVRRMLAPHEPLERRERLTALLAVSALLAGPSALVAVPGLATFLTHHCHSLLG